MIGSQHVVFAAMTIRKEYQDQNKALPGWLTHVNAWVIKAGVDIDTRQTIAGENNAVAADSESLGLSEVCERYNMRLMQHTTSAFALCLSSISLVTS